MTRNKPLTAIGLALAVIGTAQAARADVLMDKINAAATKLDSDQDPTTNLWISGFNSFNGTIISGLLQAYSITQTPLYKNDASDAANSMLAFYAARTDQFSGRYLPEEAYALSQLGNMQATPNSFRTAVDAFFNTAIPAHSGGAAGYISAVNSTYSDPSHSAIDLAYLTMAAYGTGSDTTTTSKQLYRNALISTLGNVSDSGSFPTASLAAAVWALSQTDTGLTGNVGTGTGDLAGHALNSLPALLAARIDPTTHLFSITLNGTTLGATTDTTSLALMALEAAGPITYAANIQSSILALEGAVDAAGQTHIDPTDNSSIAADAFSGRALQALVPEPASLSLLAIGTLALIARRRRSIPA